MTKSVAQAYLGAALLAAEANHELFKGMSDLYEGGSNYMHRLQYLRPTKRVSYRTIQRNAVKRRKQRAKSPK